MHDYGEALGTSLCAPESDAGEEQSRPGFPPDVRSENARFALCAPYPVPLEFTDTANILSACWLLGKDRPREVIPEKSNTPP